MEELDNKISDINDVRRLRNMEKTILMFERQLADLKKIKTILQKHVDFRFFSILCHDVIAKQKELAQELLKLRVRLDKYKSKNKDQE